MNLAPACFCVQGLLFFIGINKAGEALFLFVGWKLLTGKSGMII